MFQSQNLVPLISGAYASRSKISEAEVCINLFPELNPQDSAVPVTHYPREGKRFLSAPPAAGAGRGIYSASNGNLYAVAGNTIYFIDPNFVWKALGTIAPGANPVSMADNGIFAILVDGSPAGFTIALANNAFSALVDTTGTFAGSNIVDFSDTFFAFSTPGTTTWLTSLSGQISFNPFSVAAKSTSTDAIRSFKFNIRQIWLFGTQNTEVWYLSGGIPFPYSEWPNIFIPFGAASSYCVAQADVDVFWLSENRQGHRLALMSNGYTAIAISTRALEDEWDSYPTAADVIASVFQQAGHVFIIFNFPSADKTWAYDLSTHQWHQRTYIDSNGIAHRDKTAFHAPVGFAGQYPSAIIGQDWQNGSIYALDPLTFTDNGQPIACRRTFPHMVSDLHFITHTSFIADFETGGILAAAEPSTITPDATPSLYMRYSNDGGATFNNYRRKNLVTSGRYRSMMRWRGLGMARDRVYDLQWAYPGPSALQGAYVEGIPHGA